MGISAANIAESQIPASRVYLCSLLTVKTMAMLMRDSETRNIIHMTRTFLTYVDVIEMNARPDSWKPPPAIWTRSELRGENPKPATLILLNWVSCQYFSSL
jgi:hypothetical protein